MSLFLGRGYFFLRRRFFKSASFFRQACFWAGGSFLRRRSLKSASCVQPCVKLRVFLASKMSLSIADHLQVTFINRSTCQAYIETLKMPLMHKQPKKWWANRRTDKQTDKPNILPLLRMQAHGIITSSRSAELNTQEPKNSTHGTTIVTEFCVHPSQLSCWF